MNPNDSGTFQFDERARRPCCRIPDKTRFIMAFIIFLIGLTFSLCSFAFYPDIRAGVSIFAAVGLIIGILLTCLLASPCEQWITWREKSGPAIAFVVFIIFGIASIVVGFYINYWMIVLICIILQWMVLFAYCITIIEGGILTIRIAFGAPPPIYPEQPE